MQIHESIVKRMNNYVDTNRIPNILVHGPSGGGKRTLLSRYIAYIYKDNRAKIAEHVRYVECSQGKGIKFIREELKFFAKTNVNSDEGIGCKCVVLLNADKLTVDAQSALRRCLELFTHTTRFFMVVQNKSGILRPILSRFCIIYIPLPVVDGAPTNLITWKLHQAFQTKGRAQLGCAKHRQSREKLFEEALAKAVPKLKCHTLLSTASALYERGFTGLDIIDLVTRQSAASRSPKHYSILLALHKMRFEVRNETLFLAFGLHCVYLRSEEALENVGSM